MPRFIPLPPKDSSELLTPHRPCGRLAAAMFEQAFKNIDDVLDAIADLGKPDEIGQIFSSFQKYLYVGAA